MNNQVNNELNNELNNDGTKDETKDRLKELDADGRRFKILDILADKGKVKVSELSRFFSVSEVSIRNDLAELEQKGALERTHGGAVSTARAFYSMSFNDRISANAEEKKLIAAEAASMIKDGDAVILNSGTTTLFTARELRNHKNLKLVTNSVSIASEAGSYTDSQVILLGGSYNPQYFFIYGDDAISHLSRYMGDKLILSVDGVSAEGGITTYLHQESELIRQMMDRVKTTIVVADHTKIGLVSFSAIAPIERIDVLITDKKAGNEAVEAIREKGVEVRIV